MKAVMYKLLEIDDNAVESEFYRTEILTENELREKFLWYLQNDYFNEDLLKYYSVKKDTDEFTAMNDLDINTILCVFNENDDYDLEHTFCVEQVEIEITDNEIYD